MRKTTCETIVLIKQFREFCRNARLEEISCCLLISHHDPTLRFTNSTTSVLKPYIVSSALSSSGLFLMQPAMGLQGVLEWKRSGLVSEYTSFFITIGMLHPISCLGGCIINAETFLLSLLGLPHNRLKIGYYKSDKDIKESLEHSNITIQCEETNETDYRHSFGTSELTGRNANYYVERNGIYEEVGNLIIIHDKSTPVAVEVSFDLPLLLRAIYNYEHATETLPALEIISEILPQLCNQDDKFELADLVTLSTNLLLDGLAVKSRGREGNLRQIIKLVSAILEKYNIQEKEFSSVLSEVIQEEMLVRNELISVNKGFCMENADAVLSKYLNALSGLTSL